MDRTPSADKTRCQRHASRGLTGRVGIHYGFVNSFVFLTRRSRGGLPPVGPCLRGLRPAAKRALALVSLVSLVEHRDVFGRSASTRQRGRRHVQRLADRPGQRDPGRSQPDADGGDGAWDRHAKWNQRMHADDLHVERDCRIGGSTQRHRESRQLLRLGLRRREPDERGRVLGHGDPLLTRGLPASSHGIATASPSGWSNSCADPN